MKRILRQTGSTRHWRRFWIVLTAGLVLGSCSGSGGDKANTEGNVSNSSATSGSAGVQQTIEEWASAAAEMYSKQVEAGQSLDHLPVVQQLAPTTKRLVTAICGQLKDESDADKRSETQKAITFSVDEALARAVAQKPNLLIAAGMAVWGKYPPFILKDPAPPADAAVANAQALSEQIKPEFVAQSGGIILPKQGDASYEEFRRWFYDPSLDNPLLERATVTSQEVRSSTDPCP